MPTLLSYTLTLPPAFRPGDILAFHRRDAQEVAEAVREASLRKGLVWNGLPACLELHFQSGRADATLTIDGAAGAGCAARLEAMVHRMLGLTQDIVAVEPQHRQLRMARKVFLRCPKQAAEGYTPASPALFQRAERCMPSSPTSGMKLEKGQVISLYTTLPVQYADRNNR